MIYFYKKKSTVLFSLKLLRPFPKDELKKILRIGLPGGGEALLYNVSQTVIMGMINTCGLAAINARTYVALIVRFSYLFALAIGIAGQTVIGTNLGRGEYQKIEKTVITTRRMAVATAMLMDVILFIFIGPLLSIFHATDEVIVLSKIALMVDFFLEFGKGNNIVMTRAMTAVGDVMYPMVVGIIFMWLAAVGLSYVFGIAMGYGLIGIWVAMTIDEWSRAFILNRRFKSGKWKTIWKVE
jgi:Na+-driven multidrug efflux pump